MTGGESERSAEIDATELDLGWLCNDTDHRAGVEHDYCLVHRCEIQFDEPCPETLRRLNEVMALRARHCGPVQNMAGDWLCACGAFLCPPDDERLGRSHQQHAETILKRAIRPAVVSEPAGQPAVSEDLTPGHRFWINMRDRGCDCGLRFRDGSVEDARRAHAEHVADLTSRPGVQP